MRVLGLILILLILGFLLEQIINKLLGVKKKKVSETPGRKIDRWGRGILVVVFLCGFSFVIEADRSVIKWFWISYLIILLGFQAILEWKYLKDSNQYVTTFIFLLLGVALIYNMEYFIQLLGWD
ncbi:DUF4181 domain-containing protein [Siminovitchia fortis]|uniref:DUF4181 domain-containing protein n=1 Tax=Siminovitchia fortis TaxID=254758 RepID=A0A443IJY8_9BACI|nr:DUF4181 domain-containing protein [Siminovitchia fortis]RWR04835.1 DUF4181 domain-containing protein [Siminovitchia fortis]WHY80571.1 DUF4181 domain-containing protein [Siminovitchia fortis]